MAERLTRNSKFSFYNQNDLDAMYDKLAELEDIMEKFDIESAEELDETLDDNQYSKEAFSKLQASYQQVKNEQDTWERACELACEKISVVELITNEDMSKYSNYLPNYFYEKSKKELENKNEQ